MPAFKDLTNKKFGRLTALERAGNDTRKEVLWLCRCSCGNMKIILSSSLRSGRTKSCGCLKDDAINVRRGSSHPNWKGGRVLDKGYVKVAAPTHPRAGKESGYVREHTIVMEAILGRYLLPGESVHHKNGVKDDNRPENLELWSTSQPYGQRVEDKVKWAREILARYQPSIINDDEL